MLILEEKLLSKITYLCTQVSTKEWSGPLFFKIEGDVFDEKSDIVVRAKEMLLMSIDTVATTEFDYTSNDDTRIVDLYTENPELMDYRLGNIHSHNSMNAFFSGTDMTELKDGAKVTDLFLMLVVNNKPYIDWVAKIGISAKVEKDIDSTFTFYSGLKKTKKTKVSEIAFFNYDLDVVIENQNTTMFEEMDAQIADVEERKAKKVNTFSNNFNEGNHGDWRNFNDGYPNTNKLPVQKTIWGSKAIGKVLEYKEVVEILDLTEFSQKESISVIINNSIKYIESTTKEYFVNADLEDLMETYMAEISDKLYTIVPNSFRDEDLYVRCLEEIASYLSIYKTGNPKDLHEEIKNTINEINYVQ